MRSRILLIKSNPQRAESLYRCLEASGYRIDAEATIDSDLLTVAAACEPDLLVIDGDAPGDRLIAAIHALSAHRPLPIVVFTRHTDAGLIARAIRAGVSGYIVDGFEPRRIVSILDVAVARFHETERLHAALQETRASLAERKSVERAKGILMKQKGFDEPSAYQALRKMAMDRNLRIGQAAENVIAVAAMLDA